MLPNALSASYPARIGPEAAALHASKLAEGAGTMPIVASRTDDAVRDRIQSAMLNLVDLSLERLRGDASIIRVCQACDRQVLLDFDGKLRLWEAGQTRAAARSLFVREPALVHLARTHDRPAGVER